MTNQNFPLLIITGATATGKTSLALELAKIFNGELISCDSRQVYQHMDIVTGKDIPKNYSFHLSKITYSNLKFGYYGNHNQKIWGHDIIKPNKKFHLKNYLEYAVRIFDQIWTQKKLPIIVGGTGLYIKSILKPPETLGIPINRDLRKNLKLLNSHQLFNKLKSIKPTHAKSLSKSEKNNPHRLIRAIEIALSHSHQSTLSQKFQYFTQHILPNIKTKFIGLKYQSQPDLYRKIDNRVVKRIQHPKLPDEINYLLKNNYLEHVPSHTIGYQQIIQWMNNHFSFNELIKKWQFAEHAYARRQNTWFRKQNNINWFNAKSNSQKKQIVKIVNQWYTYR